MTYGQFPNYKTVVGWGATEDAAKEAANEKAEAEIAASTQTANKEAEK